MVIKAVKSVIVLEQLIRYFTCQSLKIDVEGLMGAGTF